MPDNARPKQDRARDEKGRWLPGASGNPTGMKRGSRHKATLAAQALLDGEAKKLARKAVKLALAGDPVALRLCMERLVPKCKERPLSGEVQLPELNSAANIAAAASAVLHSVNEGTITPQEGTALAALVEGARRAYETQELAERLEALEQALEEKRP